MQKILKPKNKKTKKTCFLKYECLDFFEVALEIFVFLFFLVFVFFCFLGSLVFWFFALSVVLLVFKRNQKFRQLLDDILTGLVERDQLLQAF